MLSMVALIAQKGVEVKGSPVKGVPRSISISDQGMIDFELNGHKLVRTATDSDGQKKTTESPLYLTTTTATRYPWSLFLSLHQSLSFSYNLVEPYGAPMKASTELRLLKKIAEGTGLGARLDLGMSSFQNSSLFYFNLSAQFILAYQREWFSFLGYSGVGTDVDLTTWDQKLPLTHTTGAMLNFALLSGCSVGVAAEVTNNLLDFGNRDMLGVKILLRIQYNYFRFPLR